MAVTALTPSTILSTFLSPFSYHRFEHTSHTHTHKNIFILSHISKKRKNTIFYTPSRTTITSSHPSHFPITHLIILYVFVKCKTTSSTHNIPLLLSQPKHNNTNKFQPSLFQYLKLFLSVNTTILTTECAWPFYHTIIPPHTNSPSTAQLLTSCTLSNPHTPKLA